MAEYSRACLQQLRADTGIAYEQRTGRTLQLFRTQAQVDAVQRDIAVLEECGVPYQLLGADQLATVEPSLAQARDRLAGGLLGDSPLPLRGRPTNAELLEAVCV